MSLFNKEQKFKGSIHNVINRVDGTKEELYLSSSIIDLLLFKLKNQKNQIKQYFRSN